MIRREFLKKLPLLGGIMLLSSNSRVLSIEEEKIRPPNISKKQTPIQTFRVIADWLNEVTEKLNNQKR